jgi:hypothetical protein
MVHLLTLSSYKALCQKKEQLQMTIATCELIPKHGENKEKVEKFKTELDNVIASLNNMLNIWMDLTNESEDEQLEEKYPFPYSLNEQISEIEEWRNNIENSTNPLT